MKNVVDAHFSESTFLHITHRFPSTEYKLLQKCPFSVSLLNALHESRKMYYESNKK